MRLMLCAMPQIWFGDVVEDKKTHQNTKEINLMSIHDLYSKVIYMSLKGSVFKYITYEYESSIEPKLI